MNALFICLLVCCSAVFVTSQIRIVADVVTDSYFEDDCNINRVIATYVDGQQALVHDCDFIIPLCAAFRNGTVFGSLYPDQVENLCDALDVTIAMGSEEIDVEGK